MRKGSIWITLGLLLIVASLVLTAWNLQESKNAGNASMDIISHLEECVSVTSQISEINENTAEQETDLYLREPVLPEVVHNPDREMPVLTIDGNDYIGTLLLPSLGLELPVMSRWSYPNLKVAPCRYAGSAYRDDLIILAHNYPSHFGNLKQLQIGEPVIFTDIEGYEFSYEVVEQEVLAATAVEEMGLGDWDLTLFTCTTGGQSRVTVRCVRVKE